MDEVMKTYQGVRDEQGCHVTVDGAPLHKWLELWNHSPTGFEWSYLGSGPAQLGLAILADHFDLASQSCTCRDLQNTKKKYEHLHDLECPLGQVRERVIKNYQRFKAQVISRLPEKSWQLTSGDVRIALLELEQEEKARGVRQ